MEYFKKGTKETQHNYRLV